MVRSTLVLLLLGCVANGAGSQQSCTPSVPQCLPALASYLQGQENIVKSVQKELQETKTKLNQAIGKWPPGSYCILANGACPAGFTRQSGYMKSLSMYTGSSKYMAAGQFGDSYIRCHGPCSRQDHWLGELFVTACCK